MVVLQWCKMQIMCLLLLIYISFVFIKEGISLDRLAKKTSCNKYFDWIFLVSEVAVLFDGITAVTVNFQEDVSIFWNRILHLCMFVSYEIYVVILFLYWVSVTVGMPKSKNKKILYIIPMPLS